MEKPCLTEKNQCSHLCLKSGKDSVKCGCPTGMELINQTNCMFAQLEFEIYFIDSYWNAKYHIVKYKNQKGLTIKSLPVPDDAPYGGFPLSIDVHLKTKMIFWGDNRTSEVCNVCYSY